VAVRLIADTAAGLHAAHELRGWDGKLREVVHCDVSPHNILIGLDGMVKLVDFGVAGVDSLVGVGVNCTAPPYIAHLIDRIAGTTYLPIIVYPNSGELYDPVSRAWTGPAQAWLGQATSWVDAGASVLGGCCRVGPGEIRELRLRLEELHAL
jgi:serine/threonine protein kinase